MSLHPQVLRDLLDAEADVARDRLGERIDGIVTGADFVEIRFVAKEVARRLRLTGEDYDRRPLSASFVDEAGKPLAEHAWPIITMGGPHPVLGTPWTCVRGTLEYHLYPGHTTAADSWDANRTDLRVADVAQHLIERCTT